MNEGKPPATESRFNRIARRPYVDGLPEWELFPSETDRLAALDEIERSMTPRSALELLKFIALAGTMFLLPWWLVGLAVNRFAGAWPHRGTLTLGLTVAVYLVLVFGAIRWSMPRDVRRQLVACGVPICMACGQALRGLPPTTDRCPECGRRIPTQVKALLGDDGEAGCDPPAA